MLTCCRYPPQHTAEHYKTKCEEQGGAIKDLRHQLDDFKKKNT